MLSITHAPTCFINLSPQIFLPYTSISNAHSLIRKGKTKNLELRFLAVKETSGGGFFELKNSSWEGKTKNLELRFLAVKETIGGEFFELKNSSWGCGGEFLRRCNRRDWEGSGGNIDLETKILEFMNSSKNPDMFPSKKQLVDAGRMDLVEAILKEGGWLALGWDFDDNVDDVDVVDWYSSLTDNKDCGAAGIQDKAIECNEEQSSQVPCSSSGRSIDIATEDDAGIGGILYRLEKERNMNLGVALKEIESITRVQSSNVNHDWLHKTTKNGTVAGLNGNNTPGLLNPKSSVISDLRGGLDHSRSFSNIDGSGNSLNPDTWRTWSIKRAAFLDVQFEAEELSSNRTCTGGEESVLGDEIIETREGASETVSRRKENRSDGWINQNQVRSRLHDLELELSSVLQSLKSNNGESVSQKVDNGRASDDLLKLSDALEFQENEIINAQDKLRSTRAKIAVSEGKIALAIIDAQKVVEEKQKRIDEVSRALQVLRTACIVWPGSASVVFLTGSFDGWAMQTRMEKSSVGVFSLYLKLFPGRYEIKFIVDDEWKIDPLRPIVHNNGYENNLLIIT